jgi:hypothetical protein
METAASYAAQHFARLGEHVSSKSGSFHLPDHFRTGEIVWRSGQESQWNQECFNFLPTHCYVRACQQPTMSLYTYIFRLCCLCIIADYVSLASGAVMDYGAALTPEAIPPAALESDIVSHLARWYLT